MVQPIEPSIAILLVWLLLYIYSIAGSVDFGASFWAMVYADKNTRAGRIANRFLSPTWEVTNTVLVLLVVAFVGFFPKAAYILGTVLLVPVSIILLLIAIRSAFMVFAYSVEGYQKALRIISGLTGLFVPALLISALPVTEGGFVRRLADREILLFDKWLSSPSVYLYMLFGLTSELFLSSLFLADYSRESSDDEAYRLYRKIALIFGPVTILVAVLTLYFSKPEAQWLLLGLSRQKEWFALSIIAFLIAYVSLWWKDGRPRVAVVFVAIQYALATFAYGVAHLPYIVYPFMTVNEAFTNIDTFYSLLKVFAVGLALLLPGFLVFWRFFLKDKRYLQKS
ncbi:MULTISPECIES: cytochrome d ubiquinol oxidase subunit II [Thermoactinomyces]|jgi:cytochrome d ubiquinol oxidase subunit II|uniref:Cytochrome d ubiquinol oxidase subunit II n=1 Tax=Thermoactinomyces daqus TaxID=1329516 RepID=A0A7W2AHB4_9BACL|nr:MULTISPECIES: cytochrome d ubiquinol oxidase subunit II [Thermoactinomyces]MBA4542506.1 cytochrome d ubiquinol oxidase subunit II [Thermoactinomyces daqus]MBH8607068.1 cytochrome d ubiquinol oxidase subunit II [Thermoactinomyces sp. CICC 10521]